MKSQPTGSYLVDKSFGPVLDQVGASAVTLKEQELWQGLIDTVPDAMVVVSGGGDRPGTIRIVNRKAEVLFGYLRDELIGKNVELLVPTGSADLHAQLRARLEHPHRRSLVDRREVSARRKDGSEVPVEISFGTFTFGGSVLISATARDVTERQSIERALRSSEARFRTTFDGAPVGMALIDLTTGREGRLAEVNEALAQTLGYSRDSLIGTSLSQYSHPEGSDGPDLAAMAAGTVDHYEGEQRYRRGDGRWIWAGLNISVVDDLAIAHLQDITPEHNTVERLHEAALHDPLTGLPNRALLMDRLSHALVEAQRTAGRVAVFYVDVDRFKQINDTLGHDVGDEVLAEVARRLTGAARGADTTARMGGDEFVVVAAGALSDEDVVAISRRIEGAVNGPAKVGGYSIDIAASVGVARSTGPDSQPFDLLRAADAAMYQAKSCGGGQTVIFGGTLSQVASEQREVAKALARALEDGLLRLYYQPIVSLNTGAVKGVEALLRIDNPDRGLLLPATFLNVAEASRLIIPIGTWVISEACRQIAKWDAALADPPVVSVNLSALQVARGDIDSIISEALSSAGANPAHLCVELTETMFLDATPAVAASLARLRALGVCIALDDFGTGYSSLTHLRSFPVDILKIDRSFIAGLGVGPNDKILGAVASLGASLDLKVVAEGIEDEAELETVRSVGCTHVQGFLFSGAVSAEAASVMIDSGFAPHFGDLRSHRAGVAARRRVDAATHR